MVRFALWRVAVMKLAPVVVVAVIATPSSGGIGRFGWRIGGGIGHFDMVAGDSQEHLVEAGTTERDVVGVDAALVEHAHDVAQLVRVAFDAGGDTLGIRVSMRGFAADPRHRVLDGGEVDGGARPDL